MQPASIIDTAGAGCRSVDDSSLISSSVRSSWH
jgi:hypothetical protein